MDYILNGLGYVLGGMMYACYRLIKNYGLAIILFTLLSKVVLMPVSVWVQKNSIKLVKMSPEINRIKARNYGSSERISELQYELYKKEHYNPLADIVPLLIQIVLLMGVVDAIYQTQERPDINMMFLGLDLTQVPVGSYGVSLWIPVLAAASALLLCYVQNRINVLQVEQGKLNRYGTTAVSVGLSLYLGLFVPTGIGLYWIFSNLFAILQLYLLNYLINPKKYIDYDDLQSSKDELAKVLQLTTQSKKWYEKDPYRRREKEDYKRFFKDDDKNLVFYAERNGFYKYFQGIIEIILNETKIPVHYVTSDPNDAVFEIKRERFYTYYVGDMKLITFMMKMDADIVAMTTPDLEQFQIKRSYVRKDIEYIYIPHSVNSENLTLRTGALDYYDTVFAVGPQYITDIRQMEELRDTKKKTLVEWGSGVIDNMIAAYDVSEKKDNKKPTILIAPSWQEDNIMELCIEDLLDQLAGKGYKVVLRPHPQYIRHFEEKVDRLREKYDVEHREDIVIEKDFTSNVTVYTADLLITDWSSIAFEYAFATLQPVLYINTPMKVMNPDYQLIQNVPIDIAIRNQVGKTIETAEIQNAAAVIEELLNEKSDYKDKIYEIREQSIYNIGNSAQIGAQYLIDRVKAYDRKKLTQD